jgi:hypothetical protein
MPNPITKFDELPKEIRGYFSSKDTVHTLTDIIGRSNLSDTSAIPEMILELLTKKVAAHDFMDAFQKDGRFSKKRAAAIVRELKEKILEKARGDLFDWGINISDINVLDAPSLNGIMIDEPETTEDNEVLPLDDIGTDYEPRKETEPVKSFEEIFGKKKEAAGEKPKTEEVKPLVIHEEKPAAETAKKSVIGNFSLPFKMFGKGEMGNYGAGGSAAKAKIEAPDNKKSVVHYSESSSSVPDFGKQESALGFGAFSPIKPVENKPEPAPTTITLPPSPPVLPAKKLEIKIDPLPKDEAEKVEVKKAVGPATITASSAEPAAETKPKTSLFSLRFLRKNTNLPVAPMLVAIETPKPETEKPNVENNPAPGQPKLDGNAVDLR